MKPQGIEKNGLGNLAALNLDCAETHDAQSNRVAAGCLSGHLAKGVSPWRNIQSTRSSVYAVQTPNPKLRERVPTKLCIINIRETQFRRFFFCVCIETRCGQVLWLGTKEDGSPNNLLLARHSSGLHAAVRTPLNGACC
jgi:hypothetical protein